MTRALATLLAVGAFAASAAAQPGNLPLSPGVRPAGPYGPGAPAGVGPAAVAPGQQGVICFPATAPWGWAHGWGGYQTYSPLGCGLGYAFGGYLPYGYAPLAPPPQAPAPGPRREPTVVLANEFPATLVLQFPAAADVWLNGQAVKGRAADERTLTSPVLKQGQRFTFEVKARWTRGGKTYESEQAVTLGPADRSRLFVVSGTEVK
ncbi:MAG: hypothetical protein ACKODX_09670 [Gemmata sp.]